MVTIFLCMFATMIAFKVYIEVADYLPKLLRRGALVVLLVLVISCPCLVLKSVIVPNATSVATIHATAESDTKTLFQENDTGKYFIIKEHMWNPWNATYREYVDTEIAEEYIQKYNELREFEIAGK